jgi:dipeptidyl aminopeptidase/acylaminoacyl peptidase
LTPLQVAQIRVVTDVQMSPDGSQIAFLRTVPRRPGVDADGDPWVELWVRREGAVDPRPYVSGKLSVSRVRWTVDGQYLTFLAKRGDDATRSLYWIPVDGGEARKVIELKADISGYELAPDGKRVALLAVEPEDESSKKWKEKGFKQEIYEEDWRWTRAWITTLNEGSTVKEPMSIEGSVRNLEWSPDSTRLAVAVTPTPSVDDGMMRQQVRVVSVETGEVLAEVEHTGKLESMAWSPEGTWLALIAGEDIHDPSGGRLKVAPATGGKAIDVVPGFAGEIQHVVWLSESSLLFVAAMGVHSEIHRLVLGEASERIETTVNGHPVIQQFSVSDDGLSWAIVGHTAKHPSEVFTTVLADADGRMEWRRETDSNPWLAGVDLAVQEVIRHTARDGLELEGILIRPLIETTDSRYPLILAVHGGPESHVSHGWVTSYSMPGQVAAARGYFVFYPNYRGSTGRGVAFSKLGQGDAAGAEFDDLVDATDYLIHRGWIDPARVGVTGGSYGGYATAWCGTRFSSRFAAGVMFVGISDKVSKVGTTDIADEEYYVHALKRPWEDWQFLLERSPIYHAGNSKTPMLILHGADDPRVNVGQSRELYRHLKMRSEAPVRLVLYPGEGHGNRKAAARYDYQLRQMEWFDRFLVRRETGLPVYKLDYPVEEDAK